MIDFEIMERALKIARIKRITEGGDASWKTTQSGSLVVLISWLIATTT